MDIAHTSTVSQPEPGRRASPSRRNPAALIKAVLKLLAFFVGTIVLGCLLAPPLFWAARALEPWAVANGLLRLDPIKDEVVARGFLAFMVTDFQKFFNRSVLIAALLLLYPTARWMHTGGGMAALYLKRNPRRISHLMWGLILGGGAVAVMAAVYLQLDIYRLKTEPPWGALPKLALSAAVVAMLEEALFRGAILGLLFRGLRPYAAMLWTTSIFAILHFLKPDDDAVVGVVTWASGFKLLPYVFHQFAEPMLLLAGFGTLFMLGWVLAYARLRTDSLWMPIGLHAGVVFVKMGFSKITKRQEEHLPWVGDQLQIGLVPMFVLLLVLFAVFFVLEWEARRAKQLSR